MTKREANKTFKGMTINEVYEYLTNRYDDVEISEDSDNGEYIYTEFVSEAWCCIYFDNNGIYNGVGC